MTRLLLLISFMLPAFASAQLRESAVWAVEAETRYLFQPNLRYTSEAGTELFFDLYRRRDLDAPQPTLVFFHGGFWVAGSKDTQLTAVLPWLEMGWNVVVAGYRLGGTAVAPAAVVDAFCVLRHLANNAAELGIDTTRIVASGQSAGGHLALATAALAGAGFDASCPAGETPEVAAVINWFGVTDVQDVISGPNRADAAARWFGDMPEREALALAARLSPLAAVQPGLPPILTIHGDADTVVPHAQGVALHEALTAAQVPNQLLTIPGGNHGQFSAAERRLIYETITGFLDTHGL